MRRCDDICAFTVCFCCEKSLKTLPFLLPFSRKGQTEEKFCTKEKNFFLSETTANTARNTQKKKKKKERKDDAREEAVRCCGNGAVEELGPTEMWTWELVLHREDILVFECSYFHAFFLFIRQEKFTRKSCKEP